MAASSSTLALVAPVANESSLAAAAMPNGEVSWSTAEFQAFGMQMHALIQRDHLPVLHLGGLKAAVEGLGSSFRLMDEDHQMGKEQAGVVYPLTQVLSHGIKMYEYPLIFVVELLIRLLFYLFSYFCCCDM